MLPEWMALTGSLPFSRSVRIVPLLRFLSARGRGPTDVSRADLDDYRDAIVNDRLRRDPEKSWDRLVWVWNWCLHNVSGWPQITLERPSKRVIYLLPWSAVRPSFKEDVDRFLLRLSGQDLSEDGPPRPARSATLQKRSYQLRIAASALVHRGVAADAIGSIADLLSLERYQKILSFFLDRGDDRSPHQAAEMAAFLKGVARHWVKVDDPTLEKMKRIASRLALPRRGMTAKNRERLRPLDDTENVAAFLALPPAAASRGGERQAQCPQQGIVIANGRGHCAAASSPHSAEESYRTRRQQEPDRPREEALSSRRRIRSEEQRADRFRAASGNTGYPGLVRQRASTVFDQHAQ